MANNQPIIKIPKQTHEKLKRIVGEFQARGIHISMAQAFEIHSRRKKRNDLKDFFQAWFE